MFIFLSILYIEKIAVFIIVSFYVLNHLSVHFWIETFILFAGKSVVVESSIKGYFVMVFYGMDLLNAHEYSKDERVVE
jgi:hypothetical protein